MISWPIVFVPVARQHIMLVTHGQAKAFIARHSDSPYNPSYSGGRDHEDQSQPQANSSLDPILKIPNMGLAQ
jgi:hypothetical protein